MAVRRMVCGGGSLDCAALKFTAAMFEEASNYCRTKRVSTSSHLDNVVCNDVLSN